MRLARFRVPGQGARLGVCEGEAVWALAAPDSSPLESLGALVELAGRAGYPLTEAIARLRRLEPAYSYRELDRPPTPQAPHLLRPVVPPEVWAAGVTYERSREARL